MKTLEDIYEEIDNYNIPILPVKFQKKKAGIAHTKFQTIIAIDYTKFQDTKEEKLTLAEEKAHYETGAYYSDCSPLSIAKAEYKAQKKMRNDVIPFEELKAKYKEYQGNIEELSDYFGVPEKEIAIAEYYYAEIEGYNEKL